MTPENTIFELAIPALVDADDATPIEVGVKFRSDVAGTIRGIRFYKAPPTPAPTRANLWTAAGGSLATATSSGETASGWQQIEFATPVAIAAGTTYVASYFAPNGHYSATSAAFSSAGADNPPLHALADSISANAVYAYSSTSTFPTSTWNATNYWVDVLFRPGS